jgi:hypothetical protein
MNGQFKESQSIWRDLPQEYQQQLLVLLGHIIQHHMATTLQRKESTTGNAVDKTAYVKHDGIHLQRGML